MTTRTRIKICGITRPEDARLVVELGADAIGLVFYPPSPRHVTVEQALNVIAVVPPFVSIVGLFVDCDRDELKRILQQVPIDLLQFHGDESPKDCEGYNRPFIKAIRMRDEVDLQEEANRFSSATGLLLDSYQAGVPGGTGESFDWARVTEARDRGLSKPIILAGGLTPTNVGEAIAVTTPYAVDVSGGVESAKGIKDSDKMSAFIEAVRAADESA
jgi:phosphoribosylanthranilate isomerase